MKCYKFIPKRYVCHKNRSDKKIAVFLKIRFLKCSFFYLFKKLLLSHLLIFKTMDFKNNQKIKSYGLNHTQYTL